jgi:hypothetical protein
MKSFTINPKKPKKRGQSVPPTKVMKSKKDYKRKNKVEDLEDSLNVRAILSKFITNIFEKNYSEANSNLSTIISEKMKNKIKKAVDKKKNCGCDCDDCKKNKKKLIKK